jgi:hypothetical protein
VSRADSPLQGRLVFLVGARRSGTNWLDRILAVHPEVLDVPSETHLFSHGIAPLAERFHEGAASSTKTGRTYFPEAEFLDAARDLCDRVFLGLGRALDPGARLIVERTPLHVAHLALIGAVYPDAAFVHIVRDGRDVARSLRSQPWGPATIEEAAAEWRDAVRAARTDGPTLSRYREVRYEDLLADPAGQASGLFEWLGLGVDDDVLKAVLDEAGVSYNTDPASPSIGTGKWRTSLSPADLVAVDAVAGDLLAELGYDVDVPAPSPRHHLLAVARGRLGRIRRWGRAPASPTLDDDTVEHRVDTLDKLLTCLHTRSFDLLDDLLAADAKVRVVSADGEVSGTGDGAREELVRVAGRTPAQVQVRSDVHPGNPCTAVLTYEPGDGTRHQRVVVAAIRADRVTGLAYYALDRS